MFTLIILILVSLSGVLRISGPGKGVRYLERCMINRNLCFKDYTIYALIFFRIFQWLNLLSQQPLRSFQQLLIQKMGSGDEILTYNIAKVLMSLTEPV